MNATQDKENFIFSRKKNKKTLLFREKNVHKIGSFPKNAQSITKNCRYFIHE